MSFLTESLKKTIKQAMVVSFDIFDTLLLRPFLKPTDVFEFLERQENCPDFAKFRVAAEPAAWAQKVTDQKDDVTLDEIYQLMPNEFQYMKQKEVDFEKKNLFLNPEIYEVFQYAQSLNKKIVICSDMYLPSDDLKEVLIQQLKTDDFLLYISADYERRKATGRLFEYVLNELKIKPNKMVHIGDNVSSDYKLPLSMGINAVFYPNPLSLFTEEEKVSQIQSFYNDSLEGRTFLGMLSLLYQYYKKEIGDNYWKKVAFLYGGPLVYSYVKFIMETAQKDGITDLAMVARDGYTLKKVFDLLNEDTNIRAHYVYAPRFTNLLSYLDLGADFVKKERVLCLADFLKNNGIPIKDATEIPSFQSELEKFSVAERTEYENYIKSLNLDNHIAVVDSISASFSSQKLISRALHQNVPAFYWWTVLTSKDDNLVKREYYSGEYDPEVYPVCYMTELLMSAPESPIVRVLNSKPVYKSPISEYEQIKIDLYPTLSKAIVDFAELVKQLRLNFSPKPTMIFNWLASFVFYADETDYKKFENIKNGLDQGHNSYIPILPKKN